MPQVPQRWPRQGASSFGHAGKGRRPQRIHISGRAADHICRRGRSCQRSKRASDEALLVHRWVYVCVGNSADAHERHGPGDHEMLPASACSSRLPIASASCRSGSFHAKEGQTSPHGLPLSSNYIVRLRKNNSKSSQGCAHSSFRAAFRWARQLQRTFCSCVENAASKALEAEPFWKL